MKGILFEYDMPPATWVYVSSLMILGIFFKFNRFLSVRNLDLAGLILFAPGFLLLSHGVERLGYIWLFSVGGVFLVRLLVDPVMVRRPLLEPNLSASGLTFTCGALLVFLTTNIIQGREIYDPRAGRPDSGNVPVQGPGYPYYYDLVNSPRVLGEPSGALPADAARTARMRDATARITAMLAQLAAVLGMVFIGYRHFDNIHTGVAAASLYLLLPYSAFMVGHVDHVLPAALLVWAVAAYRRPVISGFLVGLAGGLTFYPLFLVPLWCSYYWQRGLFRFVATVITALLALVVSLAISASGPDVLVGYLQAMFGWPAFLRGAADGFWQHHEMVFRYPVLAAFLALCGGLALWPPQKNLGTLLSCSAAVMLGVQYWHLHQGGLYMGWYLPLLVLTIFRPNLEDRVALSAVIERRTPWRKPPPPAAAPA